MSHCCVASYCVTSDKIMGARKAVDDVVFVPFEWLQTFSFDRTGGFVNMFFTNDDNCNKFVEDSVWTFQNSGVQKYPAIW